MREILNGAGTKIFFGILHPDSMAQDPIPEPPDVLVTLSAVAAAGAPAIAVASLPDVLPAGSALEFYPPANVTAVTLGAIALKGALSITTVALPKAIAVGAKIRFPGYEFEVEVSASAVATATSVSVKQLKEGLANSAVGYVFTGAYRTAYTTGHAPASATLVPVFLDEGIVSGAIALHRGMILLQGGKSAKDDTKTDEEVTALFGDSGGYTNGTATNSTWSISYEALALGGEPGYYRLAYAARHAAKGIYGYVLKRDTPPAGFTYGTEVKGICQVMGNTRDNPSTGSINFSTKFNGRGEPEDTPPRR